MAVAILDTYSQSIGSYAASFAVSAGSNRKAYLVVIHSSSSDANPPTAATLGGQSMTLIASGDSGGPEDVTATIFVLKEAGIAAMSGSAITVTGGAKTSQSTITSSVQGADQGDDVSNTRADVGASGAKTISLTRVADSFTFGVAVCDFSDSTSMTITGNPSETAEFGGTNMDVAYGGEADTARTANFGYTVGPARDSVGVVINIAPAATGPTIVSVTDPATDSMTIVMSEAAANIDGITLTYGGVTQSQSYTTGDDTTFTIASLTRSLLPPAGTVTVTMLDGVTVVDSTTFTMNAPSGYGAVTLGTPDTTEGSVLFGYAGDAPVTGDQIIWSDYPNTSIDNTGVATQTAPATFTAQVWDESAEAYGDLGTWTYSAGGSGAQIIKSGIITLGLITSGVIQ